MSTITERPRLTPTQRNVLVTLAGSKTAVAKVKGFDLIMEVTDEDGTQRLERRQPGIDEVALLVKEDEVSIGDVASPEEVQEAIAALDAPAPESSDEDEQEQENGEDAADEEIIGESFQCVHCEQVRPAEQFYRKADGTYWDNGRCKPCEKQYRVDLKARKAAKKAAEANGETAPESSNGTAPTTVSEEELTAQLEASIAQLNGSAPENTDETAPEAPENTESAGLAGTDETEVPSAA